MQIADPKSAEEAVHSHAFFPGSGKISELMRQHAWRETSFGEPERWPQALRCSLRLCLHTPAPSCIYWGPDLSVLYNDAWSTLAGKRHPSALGRPAQEMWGAELWKNFGARVQHVVQSGQASQQENHLLPVERHGFAEERYFTHTTSPIMDQNGTVQGVFHGSVETTASILGERRAGALQKVSEALCAVPKFGDSAKAALNAMTSAAYDLPFSAYFVEDKSSGSSIELRAWSGDPADHFPDASFIPNRLVLDHRGKIIPPFAAHESPLMEGLPAGTQLLRLTRPDAATPSSLWGIPVRQIIILPLHTASSASSSPKAWLMCGLSPMLPLDPAYCSFFASLSGLLGPLLNKQAQLQEELDRSRLERMALQQSQLGAWSYDPAQAAWQLSPRAAELFDGSLPSHVGIEASTGAHPPAQNTHKQMRPLDAILRDALSRNETIRLKIGLPSEGGADRWLWLQGGGDRTAHAAGLVGDYSVQHMEEEKRQETAKLAVAAKMAATTAHAINNPLESLTNLVYLASLDETLSPSTRHLLQLAETAVARVNFAAQQTLGFNHDRLGFRRADVGALLRDLVAIFESLPPAAALHFDLSRVQSLSLVCQLGALRQVLSNLISNAIQASAPGGIIRFSARLSQNHRTLEPLLRLCVADYGVGIAEEQRGQIFTAFFTSRPENANGLGLWATKTLLEKHHGTIRFRSRSSQPSGTCFMITLPTQIRRSLLQ